MYLVVSGGAYGLEDAVRMAGPRLTLMLCLVVPLTLSLPTALMAAELTALMPVEGGFYFWVKEALGPFAGFAEAYLTILYTAVDMAIYPVLFAGYLSFILPLNVPITPAAAVNFQRSTEGRSEASASADSYRFLSLLVQVARTITNKAGMPTDVVLSSAIRSAVP